VVLVSIHVCVENRVCLSDGVQVIGMAWRVVTSIVAGVGDLVQRSVDGQVLVGYSVAGRSRAQVMLCVVCTVHEETRSAGFLVWPQNQGRWFVSGLASKSMGQFLLVWPQNRCRRFLLVWPQNRWLQVPSFGLKTGSYSFVIWSSKTPRWFPVLGLKTKQDTVVGCAQN
jgi:hypothetical protein